MCTYFFTGVEYHWNIGSSDKRCQRYISVCMYVHVNLCVHVNVYIYIYVCAFYILISCLFCELLVNVYYVKWSIYVCFHVALSTNY